MGKKRKFIDKRQAETFRIISRSQKDPLIVDENAPQHVLLPVENKEKRVQIDDLPALVFPSQVEEKVGLLNRAAPHSALVLDPDLMEVYAAVDSDFDCSEDEEDIEEYLNDVVKLGGGEVKDEDLNDKVFENSNFSDEEELDDLTDLIETKSRFTEYSMTSSVMRRNEQLQLIDTKFEKMCLEYDDDEIGDLESQEIKGDGNDMVIQQVLDEYEKNRKEAVYENPGKYFNYESGEEEYEYMKIKPKEKWDCISILSKNSSTLFNHPKMIPTPPKKIHVDSKGVPVDDNRLTERNLTKHDGQKSKASGRDSIASAITVLSMRSKNETNLEKRNRKKAFRLFKRERRIEKKMNKEAFKEAEKKMVKERLHNNNFKFQVVNL